MAGDENIQPDALTAVGLNKLARLARKAAQEETPEPESLNAAYPFGGVGFPASAFGALRSDEPG